ncbi:MAG: DUF1559 domain-containing protein [Isosphaeraceae bacterium]
MRVNGTGSSHRASLLARRNDLRRGLSPGEVLVVAAIVAIVILVALVSLPRQREQARIAGCRRNLLQIGLGLALYERVEGQLPRVAPLDPSPSTAPPLRAILESLVIPDLDGLTDAAKPPKPQPGSVPNERPVRGFTCPSDLASSTAGHVAPVSYRATTGDRVSGETGGFAPGRAWKSTEIEEGDGRSFTAAYSERRLGTGHPEAAPANYRKVTGPLDADGCPSDREGAWSGDAGASWSLLSWSSTLYNHTLAPNALPSCLADDGKSAHMGASSLHVSGVNVLMFDGSVRTVTPSIALPVWKAMATVTSPSVPSALP